jgi:hypothetical protein
VIGHGLVDLLERAEAPVITNIAGPGGIPGTVHWDDLQLRKGYAGRGAAFRRRTRLPLKGEEFDPERAERLAKVTEKLVEAVTR